MRWSLEIEISWILRVRVLAGGDILPFAPFLRCSGRYGIIGPRCSPHQTRLWFEV